MTKIWIPSICLRNFRKKVGYYALTLSSGCGTKMDMKLVAIVFSPDLSLLFKMAPFSNNGMATESSKLMGRVTIELSRSGRAAPFTKRRPRLVAVRSRYLLLLARKLSATAPRSCTVLFVVVV